MQLACNSLMSAGNKSIDIRHKDLLYMVNDIENAIRSRDAAALLHAFKLFEHAVRIRYIHEEKIARAIDHAYRRG